MCVCARACVAVDVGVIGRWKYILQFSSEREGKKEEKKERKTTTTTRKKKERKKEKKEK